LRRFFKRESLLLKILVPTVGLILVLFSIVLTTLSARVESQTRRAIEEGFQKTQRTFDRFREAVADYLITRCILISDQPQFKASLSILSPGTVTTEQHRTILDSVEGFLAYGGADFGMVTDRNGLLLARTDAPTQYGTELDSIPSVYHAIQNIDPDSLAIWIEGEELFEVASVPIRVGNDFIGTLSLGSALGQMEADRLKLIADSEASFLIDHRVVASTLPEESRIDLAKATFVHESTIRQACELVGRTEPIEVELSGERFLVTIALVAEGREESKAYYAVATSLDSALAPLRRMQLVILFLGIGALAVAGGFSYLIAHGITAPVRKVVEVAHLIESGNYQVQVAVESADEIGMLARAFNEMTSGLRERFQMEKYVSASTLNMIRERGTEDVQLGGERKNVAVLFSDIRGFTAFSEKVDPEEVVNMLNMYLSKQARTVSRHGGVVDKFVGDELVAIFEGPNMVDDAVRCAVEIQGEMKRLREQLPHKVAIGIGINAGMVIMGNMGSEERMDYTVLGSNVNLGARLCSSAGPGQILISESAYRLLTAKLQVTPLEAIQVKGFSRSVQIYEVT
jgi:adenylate cyclase